MVGSRTDQPLLLCLLQSQNIDFACLNASMAGPFYKGLHSQLVEESFYVLRRKLTTDRLCDLSCFGKFPVSKGFFLFLL